MRGGDSGGQGEGSKVKATKTSGEGECQYVIQSPSDCNISSLYLLPRAAGIPFPLFVLVLLFNSHVFSSYGFPTYSLHWYIVAFVSSFFLLP